ncbi:MAG: hypothetical protein KF776_18820 [Burkholderiales bacterium]|nr:hypothetical protein [Burkholderiales bacterium]MBX3716778.1 hypothetical protein [Burkholderiales bacterium]
MRLLALAVVAAALAACASGPPAPEWQATASGALSGFQSAWLAGRTKVAEQEFARARDALAATGQPGLVARAELVRCATRTASLEFDDCPGYRALAADAAPAERAYAAYLEGRAQAADIALLPEHHRAAASANLGAIADPLSRLVAAGVLFRRAAIAPEGIAVAVETASAQGWRRPLLAWLGVQHNRAEAAGDRQAAEAIRRRIQLVAGEDRPK